MDKTIRLQPDVVQHAPLITPRRVGILLMPWIALFATNALGILPWRHLPFPNVDLAEMVYEVQRLQHGYLPYRDTFTHHFLGYLVPFYYLSQFASLTPFVLKGLTLCFNFTTAILVFMTLREIADDLSGWIGATLTATVGWFWNWQGFAFNVQSYLNPILALVLLLTVLACNRRSSAAYWWSAFFAGALVTCDQRAAPFVLLLAVPPGFIAEIRRPSIVGTATACFAVCPLACVLYLWRAGALSDFVEQTIMFPLYFRNQGVPSGRLSAFFALLRFLFETEPIAVTLGLVGLLTLVISREKYWFKCAFVTTLLCSTIYAALGGRLYNNYLLIFAPIALIAMGLIPWYFRRASPVASVLAIGILAGIGLFYAARSISQPPFAYGPSDQTAEQAADYLHTHTEPQDPVLVWGFAPQIYVFSDRFTTFRDAGLLSVAGANFASILARDQGRLPHMVREFDAFLKDTPPKVIVYYRRLRDSTVPCYGHIVSEDNLDFRRASYLNDLRIKIATEYRVALTIDGLCDHAEIFMRE
jgi:hypothetical protein